MGDCQSCCATSQKENQYWSNDREDIGPRVQKQMIQKKKLLTEQANNMDIILGCCSIEIGQSRLATFTEDAELGTSSPFQLAIKFESEVHLIQDVETTHKNDFMKLKAAMSGTNTSRKGTRSLEEEHKDCWSEDSQFFIKLNLNQRAYSINEKVSFQLLYVDEDDIQMHVLAERIMTIKQLMEAQIIQLADESQIKYPMFCSFLVKTHYHKLDRYEEGELRCLELNSANQLSQFNRTVSIKELKSEDHSQKSSTYMHLFNRTMVNSEDDNDQMISMMNVSMEHQRYNTSQLERERVNTTTISDHKNDGDNKANSEFDFLKQEQKY